MEIFPLPAIKAKGTDIGAADKYGVQALCYALQANNMQESETLVKARASTDVICNATTGEMPIHLVAKSIGNPALFSLIVDKENIYFPDRSGRTAYCIISSRGMTCKRQHERHSTSNATSETRISNSSIK